jgi:MtN3 and saliva related transmembrane protein
MMAMDYSWCGIAASLCTMFGFIPQVVKIHRTRSVKDVSLATLLQFTIGCVLWISYGVFRSDPIIVSANIVTLVSLIAGLILYRRFSRMPR